MSRYRRGYASDNVTLKDNLEDVLIDSIESDDENKKYKEYRSSIKSFYTVSMKRFKSSDVKNIKYDAKCDFKLLEVWKNSWEMQDENEKLNLLDLYSFNYKK